jgi:hypothetical protein
MRAVARFDYQRRRGDDNAGRPACRARRHTGGRSWAAVARGKEAAVTLGSGDGDQAASAPPSGHHR